METGRTKRKNVGRPAKNTKREIRAAVRFTKSEYFIVKEMAAKAGINVSDYLRQVAINAEIKSRLTDEEKQFVSQLIGMSNNLNQIAKICHQEGILKSMAYFENYRSKIDGILQKLKV